MTPSRWPAGSRAAASGGCEPARAFAPSCSWVGHKRTRRLTDGGVMSRALRARDTPLRAEAADRRAIVVFALTLGLVSADMAAVGAAAAELKSALHIGNSQLGVLAGVTTIAGALATLPVGVLVDRVCRTRL